MFCVIVSNSYEMYAVKYDITINDMKIVVDDLQSRINGNPGNALEYLKNQFKERFELIEKPFGEFFVVDRFNFYIGYNLGDTVAYKKGFYIHFKDRKRIMTDFKKPLSEFLHMYLNPEGYFILEAAVFIVQ